VTNEEIENHLEEAFEKLTLLVSFMGVVVDGVRDLQKRVKTLESFHSENSRPVENPISSTTSDPLQLEMKQIMCDLSGASDPPPAEKTPNQYPNMLDQNWQNPRQA